MASKLARHTSVFAGGTLISRVTGMANWVILGALVPGFSYDAFLAAWRLPNTFRELVGEGAMNAAFVPTFTELHGEKDGGATFREAVAASMGTMLFLLAGLTLLGMLVMPALVGAMNHLEAITGAPPKAAAEVALAANLARWVFPYLLFIGAAVFCMGPLFVVGHYGTPSWSPALLNLSLMAACWLLRDRFADPAWALVVGVWGGGIAQWAVLYFALGRKTGVWRPRFAPWHPAVRSVFWLMIPVVLGQAAGEVNKLVDALFAVSLETGTVKALFYANRLIQLPLSLFGIATAVAVLPAVSAAFARKKDAEARATLTTALRQTLFLMLPAALMLIVLARPAVRLLFAYGVWNAADTERTARAILILALGLTIFGLVKVLVTGFYGAKDTRTPVIVSSCAMVLNIALNTALVGPLRYQGLALATTLSYTCNFLALYVLLWRRVGPLWTRETTTFALRVGSAGVAAAALAYAAHAQLAVRLGGEHIVERAVLMLAPLSLAAAAYLGLCAYLRVPEMHAFTKLLGR